MILFKLHYNDVNAFKPKSQAHNAYFMLRFCSLDCLSSIRYIDKSSSNGVQSELLVDLFLSMVYDDGIKVIRGIRESV